MKTIQTIRLIILVFVSLTMNLYGRESQTKISDFQWKICSPSEQGLNSDKLTDLVDLIREGKRYPRIQSLLIVRHGCLVVEEYSNNWKAERLHILQSVTKSFTSALIGMAIAGGVRPRAGINSIWIAPWPAIPARILTMTAAA